MKGGVVGALVALVLGLALGVAAAASGASTLARIVEAVEPIGTLWVNAIRMTVIPLVVASLITSAATTSAGSVGRLGARAFAIFIALLAVTALFAALVAPPVFALLTVDQSAAAALREAAAPVTRPDMPGFGDWLVALIPANPFRAAADGAMLPLVLFSILFGLSLGRAPGGSRETVVAFFRGVADAMLVLVRWIVALAPIGVFVLALGLAARVGTRVVSAVGFYLVAYSALLIGAIVLLYLIIVLFGRVPLSRFARAAAPAQVVAATTRASVAALPAMLQSAERTLGLSRQSTSFGLPLAVSVFRLNQPVSWIVMALFAAELYGIELAPGTIASLAITSVATSFSVPGIPSASLFVVAPFYASVGIPAEAVGVLLALDVVPDVFKTTLNVTGHMTSVTLLDRNARAEVVVALAPDSPRPMS